MIKAIIVDDEQHCTDRLKILLEKHYNTSIQLIGEASSVETAKTLINNNPPDLIFLDIQIHDQTGFDLLNNYSSIPFYVIFTTAYEQYAIKAFKFSAIDYLLKPIDIDDLNAAINKVATNIQQNDYKLKFDLLYANFHQLGLQEKKIAVPTISGIEFILISSIIRCESNINYTTLHLTGKAKLVVAKTLKEFEELLTEYNFYRVHNSHLINLSFVKAYNKGKGGSVLLTDGTEIEVSFRRKDGFLNIIKHL
ncbi:MAG: LytTR family DNA-binding domain-containing protein [Chitinophagaceae bacterium]|nr:LytTR family DNA-binding domain-containing protein [Chitinophagaceae bacterium]